MAKLTENFYDHEFRCRASGLLILHPGFIETLQLARDDLGEVMAVTSGCRSRAHSDAIGGHPRSLHICDVLPHADRGQLGALACDLAAVDGAYRARLFTVLWRRGFSIGWNGPRKFLHADLRTMIGMPQTTFDY